MEYIIVYAKQTWNCPVIFYTGTKYDSKQYQQMVDFNNTFYQFQEWPHGEIWGLGDSPTVGLLLAEVQRTDLYEMVEAPEISYEDMSYHFTGKNRKIRVYHDPNAELTLRDFFAKLKLNYGM